MRNALAALLLLATPALASDLNIDGVYQRTPVWCWAAVGEMVFTHYGVANINPGGDFQCGIIALLHPVCDQNCYQCVVGAGSLSTMNNMLTQYPAFASRVTHTSTQLTARATRSRLSLPTVQSEIDAGRPIVAGISPSGYRTSAVSEHVALIVGYDDDDLIVNDPFPFETAAFAGDPYVAAGGEPIATGQYRIPYNRFVSRLNWKESIYGIQCSGSDCANTSDDDDDDDDAVEYEEPDDEQAEETSRTAQYGHSCSTPVTRCGPFYDQPALPVGSPCWCGTPYGPSNGVVTRP